jgi:DNA-3-methyladenine glycosylase II
VTALPTLASVGAAAARHCAAADAVLARLIARTGTLDLTRRLEVPPDEHFGALFACIIGQRQAETDTVRQLETFRKRYGTPFPNPQQLVQLSEERLAVLLKSHRKAAFIHRLAVAVCADAVYLDDLQSLPDEAVAQQLQRIRGIGPWSIEQILFWHLERPNVLVTGDPAVKRALVRAYELKEFPSAMELAKLASCWQPYRSFVAHLLLQSDLGPGESISWPRHGRPVNRNSVRGRVDWV